MATQWDKPGEKQGDLGKGKEDDLGKKGGDVGKQGDIGKQGGGMPREGEKEPKPTDQPR